MIAITVDDERPMLNALTDIVSSSPDIEAVYAFSVCSGALEWVSHNNVDIAFLDIHMRGITHKAQYRVVHTLRTVYTN